MASAGKGDGTTAKNFRKRANALPILHHRQEDSTRSHANLVPIRLRRVSSLDVLEPLVLLPATLHDRSLTRELTPTGREKVGRKCFRVPTRNRIIHPLFDLKLDTPFLQELNKVFVE
jgi:hypothetical protein